MGAKNIITDDICEQVKELFDQGLGARKISKLLGISRWMVQTIYKELGVYNIGRTQPKRAYKQTKKSCATCSNIKPVKQFRKRIGKYKDGTERISYESSCLECERQYDNKRLKKRAKILRQTDPHFVLHKSISLAIWKTLKTNNGSKNGNSCLKFLSYTTDELKLYLESLFESWMTWDNYGVYNPKTWDDNDQTTWTWQLDHITPQSDLPYASMEDENFKKCWSLSNLRPLNAKKNNSDGVKRIRHISKISSNNTGFSNA